MKHTGQTEHWEPLYLWMSSDVRMFYCHNSLEWWLWIFTARSYGIWLWCRFHFCQLLRVFGVTHLMQNKPTACSAPCGLHLYIHVFLYIFLFSDIFFFYYFVLASTTFTCRKQSAYRHVCRKNAVCFIFIFKLNYDTSQTWTSKLGWGLFFFPMPPKGFYPFVSVRASLGEV